MRSISLLWLVAAITVVCAGCGHRGAEKPNASASEQTVFASRLDAATGIGDTVARDAALSKLATDAAAAGEGEIAKKAVESISYSVTKNDIASKSALKLAQGGKGDDANALARLIVDTITRDSTLARIAKGEFGE